MNNKKRESWATRYGFLVTSWFAAIGIGNMWRFPFRTAQNGGGAFLVPYILFILILSIPAVLGEAATGKYTQSNPVGAYRKISGYSGIGLASIILNIVVAYYMVVVSYTFAYLGYSIAGTYFKVDAGTLWNSFVNNIPLVYGLFVFTLILSAIPPLLGIQKGIERVSKILGTCAFAILLICAIRGVTLPGASAGIEYYLKPNWGKMFSAITLTNAMGQAFFTFGAGWGWFLVLSSYLKKHEDVGLGYITTGFADTSFALLAGFAVIPTMIALGVSPEVGAGIPYVAMPLLFSRMAGGRVFAILFFAAFAFAAYTCAYVLIEVIAAWFIDEFGLSRRKAVALTTIILLITGTPAALSSKVLESLDTIFGVYFLPIAVILQVIGSGYIFGAERLRITVINPYGNAYIGKWWTYAYKFVVPIICTVLMLWYAYTISAGGGPWYLGWGGFLIVIVLILVTIYGSYLYDKKKGLIKAGGK